jgi:hypothetical protein
MLSPVHLAVRKPSSTIESTKLVIDANSGEMVQKIVYKQKAPNLFGMKVLNSRQK